MAQATDAQQKKAANIRMRLEEARKQFERLKDKSSVLEMDADLGNLRRAMELGKNPHDGGSLDKFLEHQQNVYLPEVEEVIEADSAPGDWERENLNADGTRRHKDYTALKASAAAATPMRTTYRGSRRNNTGMRSRGNATPSVTIRKR